MELRGLELLELLPLSLIGDGVIEMYIGLNSGSRIALRLECRFSETRACAKEIDFPTVWCRPKHAPTLASALAF